MTTTPSTRVRTSWYWMKKRPRLPASTPIATNTTVKPAMNRATPASRRPRPPATPREREEPDAEALAPPRKPR